ncbi:MAG: hypothetical protein FWF46_03870 [Oscillospiraceae bacterium]|nr:hypothetical protein [Oscillospiraceae bacterium]
MLYMMIALGLVGISLIVIFVIDFFGFTTNKRVMAVKLSMLIGWILYAIIIDIIIAITPANSTTIDINLACILSVNAAIVIAITVGELRKHNDVGMYISTK